MEKRYYKMTGKGFEAYYAGHGLDKIRIDAAKEAGAFPADISHKTMKGSDFYEELEKTEQTKRVKPGKVKGVGQKWVVQEDDEPEPYGDPCNEPPPGWGVEMNPISSEIGGDHSILDRMRRQNDDDRVGLPEEDDDYEEDEVRRYYGKVQAIAGYSIPPDDEDKYETGKLEIPTVEQQEEELAKLRRNPDTYHRSEDERKDEEKASELSAPVRSRMCPSQVMGLYGL